jgi:hypothetical protein
MGKILAKAREWQRRGESKDKRARRGQRAKASSNLELLIGG